MTSHDASCKLLRIGMFNGINWVLYRCIGPLMRDLVTFYKMEINMFSLERFTVGFDDIP